MSKASRFSAEQSIIKKCLNGDRDSLNLIFESHRGLVVFWISQHFRSVDDVDDMFQEIWGWVLTHVDRWPKEPKAFTRWLKSVCRNKCLLEHQRRYAVKRRMPGPAALLDSSIPAKTDESVDFLMTDKVRAALQSMQRPNREALVLFHVDGLTIAQIAMRQGVSRDGAKDRLERGRFLFARAFA